MTFQPVKLTWAGREYLLPPDQIVTVICKMEDVITLFELQEFSGKKGTVPLGKVASAYAIALNHVGCPVTDLEVFSGMFPSEGQEVHELNVAAAVKGLMVLMMPPKKMQESLSNSGNSPAPQKSGGRLKRRTKRGSRGDTTP